MYKSSAPSTWEEPAPPEEEETKRPASGSQKTEFLEFSAAVLPFFLMGACAAVSWTVVSCPRLCLTDKGDWLADDWYMGLKWSMLEICCTNGDWARLETWGLLKLLRLWPHVSLSSLLARLGGYELFDFPALLFLDGKPWLLLTGLLLPLTLLLQKSSASYGCCRPPIGRRTDDDALAFAAALIASVESNFASFHALIRTGRWANLFPLSAPTASGSTVDGKRPGSRCGITSSCL